MTSYNYIKIPLSKQGKNAGQYEAMASPEDKDLAEFRWYTLKPSKKHRSRYVAREEQLANGKTKHQYLHREVMERVLGRKLKRSEHIDHIDGNGLNNQRDNLRLATPSQNAMNRPKQNNNTSGYKGVSWSKKSGKWIAKIKVNGKSIYLGSFDSIEDAYEFYCNAVEKYHGEFGNTGE